MLYFAAIVSFSLLAGQIVNAVPSEYELRFRGLRDFSFESWAKSIGKDPQSGVLLPQEVIDKYANLDTAAKSSGHHSRRSGNNVECNVFPDAKGSVADTIWCINDLASRGATGIDCTSGPGFETVFCSHGQADIIGQDLGSADKGPITVNCADVAAAAGRIIDSCQSGGLAQGQTTVIGENDMGIAIGSPRKA